MQYVCEVHGVIKNTFILCVCRRAAPASQPRAEEKLEKCRRRRTPRCKDGRVEGLLKLGEGVKGKKLRRKWRKPEVRCQGWGGNEDMGGVRSCVKEELDWQK